MFNPSVSTVNLPLTRGVNLSPTERGQFVRLFHTGAEIGQLLQRIRSAIGF